MLLVYVLAMIMLTLDSASKAAAQNTDYEPCSHHAFSLANTKPRITAITTGDRITYVFMPYADSQRIDQALVTVDFRNYAMDNAIKHLAGRDVLPLFAVFDPNATGLANDYVMGVSDDGTDKIVGLRSVRDQTVVYCENCIRTGLTGYTSTSWDLERKRWISLTDLSPGDAFTHSIDLQKWESEYWLSNADFGGYENILEMFPITDMDDSSKTVWVLFRNSKPDAKGRVTLLWDTFQPDSADQKYKQMGVLDASTYINEYALVNGRSTDYRRRTILVSQRADYKANGIEYDTYITGRELTFKDGRLRQMPVSTVYGSPTYEKFFPTIDYVIGSEVLKCLPPARCLKIEAVLPLVDGLSGFDFFISPDGNYAAATFFIDGDTQEISLTRVRWFAPGPEPSDKYDDIYNYFLEPVSGSVKVLVWIDVCIIEYFILDGLYVGSIFVFPNLDSNHHEVHISEASTITNLTFTKYDDI